MLIIIALTDLQKYNSIITQSLIMSQINNCSLYNGLNFIIVTIRKLQIKKLTRTLYCLNNRDDNSKFYTLVIDPFKKAVVFHFCLVKIFKNKLPTCIKNKI